MTDLTESVRLRLSPETIRLLKVIKEEFCFASLDATLLGISQFVDAHKPQLSVWAARYGEELLTPYGRKRLGGDGKAGIKFKIAGDGAE